MKKQKKAKPDFSKPKPVKAAASEEEIVNEVPQNTEKNSEDEIRSQRKSKTEKFFPDKVYQNLPLIVIAGRPNVGKSTLFNALTHTKRAITDPTPGVTRDPVEGTCFLDGKPVHLMDTGGYKLTRDFKSRESEMDDLVVEKTIEMIERADRILLLLDATEITGEDEELIQRLRPYSHKLIAAVNKTEGGKNEHLAYNYMKFGFKDISLISASHGDGLTDLQKKMVEGLDFSHVSESSDENRPIRIAILGKPNVGKSTLSNALTHTEASIVSDYAGTTRDVVEGSFRYNGRDIQILDTAGIRRKKKVTENVEYYSVNRAIKTLDECDIAFIMIDAKEGLAEQDKKITSLAFERGRGVIFILNKWDLLEDQSNKAIRDTKDWIQTMFGQMNWAPIITMSAKNHDGLKNLMNTALEIYTQLTRKVDTASINMALRDWLANYPPPATKAIHFKIRYITQTSVNPVNFLIFATRPDNVPLTYVSYLKNKIRQDLGFDQIPVQIEMKASRQKWETREQERNQQEK
ncbi:MAG: ribosome biogenesis GTPase Der [Treponema sp.]|nr:ribosome biogenesis GTPase Der [Spirochaetia bacterium]MDD7458306.1 ribosome biogenesis GTPase Der [Spirochaetales bacterium]MDY5811388.1 ribosome biogenesis GTPase Der [Treponema sp.]MEE1181501.1 ribosome biogenesis GTPase Der [Treponema sp.]